MISQRIVPALLLVLLVSLHAQLWLGRGSISQVNQLQARLVELKQKNKDAAATNELLASQVRDLKEGLEMVESIARTELGMIQPNEILIQYSR